MLQEQANLYTDYPACDSDYLSDLNRWCLSYTDWLLCEWRHTISSHDRDRMLWDTCVLDFRLGTACCLFLCGSRRNYDQHYNSEYYISSW